MSVAPDGREPFCHRLASELIIGIIEISGFNSGFEHSSTMNEDANLFVSPELDLGGGSQTLAGLSH